MNDFANHPTAELGVDLLFECLCVHDSRVNGLAMVILSKTGNVLHRRLIEAALETRNRSAHRVRLLRTVLCTGVPLDAASLEAIWCLVDDRNWGVRRAAAEVLSYLGEDVKADDEEVDVSIFDARWLEMPADGQWRSDAAQLVESTGLG